MATQSLRLLSVIIPARDEAGCIASTVQHLHLELALNGIPHEIVVVDDGSRDAPERVLPPDPRVRLLRQPASGIVAALEHGRFATDAPYLARLDCDDLALPGRIAAQLAAESNQTQSEASVLQHLSAAPWSQPDVTFGSPPVLRSAAESGSAARSAGGTTCAPRSTLTTP
jgi:glycosyltransferase involved in cell wall biosynthesis